MSTTTWVPHGAIIEMKMFKKKTGLALSSCFANDKPRPKLCSNPPQTTNICWFYQGLTGRIPPANGWGQGVAAGGGGSDELDPDVSAAGGVDAGGGGVGGDDPLTCQ